MRASERAWAALAIGVIGYEVMAPQGEMLSHAFDGFLERHPIITWGCTLLLAAHLLNVLPPRFDPFNMRLITGLSIHEMRGRLRARS